MHTARDFIFLDEGVEYPHQGMERGEDRNGIAQTALPRKSASISMRRLWLPCAERKLSQLSA